MATLMYRIRHILIVILLFTPLLLIGSCANYFIAKEMVKAPNQSLLGSELSRQFERVNNATDELIRSNGFARKQVSLGNEDIAISYYDIAAGDYGYQFNTWPIRDNDPRDNNPRDNDPRDNDQPLDPSIEHGSNNKPRGRVLYIHTQWRWHDKDCFVPQSSIEQNGTLLMLHGWGRDNRSLISYAVQFAQLGLRVIVPDLRGHGQSSSEWLSFGEQEAVDIKLLADHLQLRGYDVLGFSLGASTALHLASLDNRVNRIIAVAAMHSIEQTIPKFGARSRPWIAWILEDEEKDIVSKARQISGLDLSVSSDTLSVARYITNPTLLVYGEVDHMSDASLNQTIFDALQGPRQLTAIQGMRHTHLLQHQSALSEVVISWLGLVKSGPAFSDITCELQEYVL